MKIVVYAIAKNEEKHVARFMESVKEADAVYVLDTGSTDNTVQLLRDAGAIVDVKEISPWRFDKARNVSLEMVPKDVDVCVCIDLDEVFTPGWRKGIEEAWRPDTSQLQYNYIWSRNADGTPGVSFWISKIHTRKNFKWIHPVHEVIHYTGKAKHVAHRSTAFEVHHYPDVSKSRSTYLPLLELGVKEDPLNDRNTHYLGRELMMYGETEKALVYLKKHLTLKSAVWDMERAASMRFIARCLVKLGKLHEAKTWALKACAETPFEREPWWELANVAHASKDYRTMYFAATSAISNGKKGENYIADETAWGYGPFDYAAVGAHFIGFKEDAAKFGEMALIIAQKSKERPEIIERLMKNYTAFATRMNQPPKE